MAASVASTTAMESATTAMEATPAVEPTITSEASAIKPASVAIAITTTTVITPAVETTTIEAAAIETTAVISMEPRASPNEESVCEPIRSVIAVWRTSVGIIVIVTIGANRSRADVCRAHSNADYHSLSIGE